MNSKDIVNIKVKVTDEAILESVPLESLHAVLKEHGWNPVPNTAWQGIVEIWETKVSTDKLIMRGIEMSRILVPQSSAISDYWSYVEKILNVVSLQAGCSQLRILVDLLGGLEE